MSKPNYRVTVQYDSDRKTFVASVLELEHCRAEGATRAEAIAKAEEEIDAQLANMLSHGSTPPRALDEEQFTGEFSLKISKQLHRDLAFFARNEGVDLSHAAGEMLAAAIDARKQGRGRPGSRPSEESGNRHSGANESGPRRGGYGRSSYSPALDDRANFIEYVRGLEQSQGQAHGPGHGRGGHGGGHNGQNDRGRRRRRGGGSNPSFRNDQRPGDRNGAGQPAAAATPAAPAPPANTDPGSSSES